MNVRGLYVITDEDLIGDRLIEAVGAAIGGGARLVQYRNKQRDARDYRAKAAALAALCRDRNALLIINDDPLLAHAVGASGVHIGDQDGGIAAARAILGAGACIGVSCYNDFERARAAVRAGCDYLAFGSFYPSTAKPGAVRATPALLRRAKHELSVPVVAIGGITAENGARLIAAGADSLAVIHAVFAAHDIGAAARSLQSLFATNETGINEA